MSTATVPPRVFMSYCDDDRERAERMVVIADRLRANGIDAMVDLNERSPPEGWPAWYATQIEQADFVLVVCTEIYRERLESREPPTEGPGVLCEAPLIRRHLYDVRPASAKFVPVLFAGGGPEDVLPPLRDRPCYRVDHPEQKAALVRLIFDEPFIPGRPLRWRRPLPIKPRRIDPGLDVWFTGRRGEYEKVAAALTPEQREGEGMALFLERLKYSRQQNLTHEQRMRLARLHRQWRAEARARKAERLAAWGDR